MPEPLRRLPAGTGLIRTGAGLIVGLSLAALLAPLLSLHHPNEQIDPGGAAYSPPGTRLAELRFANGRRWLVADLEVGPHRLTAMRGGRPIEIDRSEVVNLRDTGAAETHLFPLGTDHLGRDCWSRILYGARVSLLVGLTAALLSAGLGLAVGVTAAAAGGWVDMVLMRLADTFLSFPRLFLVLALSSFLHAGALVLILVLGGTGWMSVSRLLRAEVLRLKKLDFIAAARSGGSSPMAIAWRHLVRNALTPLITTTALRVGNIILVESALSYLGLGIQPPTATWGNMIHAGWMDLSTAWWTSVFPGLAIVVTVIAFNLLGDGLRDRLQPRLQIG